MRFRDLRKEQAQITTLLKKRLKFAELAHYLKRYRSRQDSNLRGESPLVFESNALTARPRLLYTDFVLYKIKISSPS